MSEKVKKVSRNKTTRQQDFVDVATRLFSWQKGLFPTICTGKAVGVLFLYLYISTSLLFLVSNSHVILLSL